MPLPQSGTDLNHRFQRVRQRTEALCRPLETEDYVVQPVADVSPPKWHLGHTTWFWEQFVLQPHVPDYEPFHEDFSFVFNSYYESVGRRVLRAERGNLSRPTVAEVYRYRAYVDEQIGAWLDQNRDLPTELEALLELGLNHEEQHQELLVMDIKYILGHNPLFPAIDLPLEPAPGPLGQEPVRRPEGLYEIGYRGSGFCFDNELGAHRVYLPAFQLAPALVTNGEYLEFMQAGGYRHFRHWLADGWDWVRQRAVEAPLYWHRIDGQWHHYTFEGLLPVRPEDPVGHVSYYEADAYARWRGSRLPTEFEWEAAADELGWGTRWEWTQSAYLPYPGFRTAEGAVGEYNGKFMVGQQVLRGGSVATPSGHARTTYRNFFQPDKQWQFSGIRLAQ